MDDFDDTAVERSCFILFSLACILLSTLLLILQIHPNTYSIDINACHY